MLLLVALVMFSCFSLANRATINFIYSISFWIFVNNIHMRVLAIVKSSLPQGESSFKSDRVENSICILEYFSINQIFHIDVLTENAWIDFVSIGVLRSICNWIKDFPFNFREFSVGWKRMDVKFSHKHAQESDEKKSTTFISLNSLDQNDKCWSRSVVEYYIWLK